MHWVAFVINTLLPGEINILSYKNEDSTNSWAHMRINQKDFPKSSALAQQEEIYSATESPRLRWAGAFYIWIIIDSNTDSDQQDL